MKIILGLAGLGIIVAVAVLWIFVPSSRFAPICAPAEAWAIDHGLIKVEDADWGYLKLRSGSYGTQALRDLRRHAGSERVAATAAAVEHAYHAKGAPLGFPFDPEPAPAESRISELSTHLPADGRLTPFHLKQGQTIPAGLLDDIRFQIGCPRGACFMQLDDVNGDGRPEAIFVDRTGLRIFSRQPSGWASAVSVGSCAEDDVAFIQGRFAFIRPRFDDLMVNGHRLVFRLSECAPWHLAPGSWGPGTAPNPYSNVDLARPYAKSFGKSPVVSPRSGSLPANLVDDMAKGTLVTDTVTGGPASFVLRPKDRPAETIPLYADKAGLPRCVRGDYDSHCIIVLADLDHDGRDEVIVVDSGLTTGETDYHDVTLLAFDGQHWHATAHGDLCTEWGKDPAHMAYAPARPLWPNLSIDAKRIAMGGDYCEQRRMVLY